MANLIKKIKSKFSSYKKKTTPETINYDMEIRSDNIIKIIFFLPVSDYPSGGIIVAHDHSETINELGFEQYISEIMYPTDINFVPKLFVHNSQFKRDYKIDLKKDFIILPEVMALRYAEKLNRNAIKFGIHVQNGYLLNLECNPNPNSISKLKKAYQSASLIIGNSNDTIENIKFIFPEVATKIIRSYFVINKNRYQQIQTKKNYITYMPRKLSKHSQLLLFFLNEKIPNNWKIIPIDGVTEQEVYNIFYESKIFLSFSEFEGLAMPPAMAAMSGNMVIGYTGEANKEYFHLPCFDEVPCGDIKLFASKVIETINKYENDNIVLDMNSIQYLESLFSKEKQKKFLSDLIFQVDNLLK
tara:strand:- start:15978 stop:17048 length:1071 start_codon:yes stop_codon:yes gene_type:complete